MIHSLKAAAAASLLLALPAFAQDEEAAAPTTYVLAEDGAATHNDTGAVCPASIGDMVLAQVLSYDTAERHIGISCQYLSANGFTSAITVARLDEPAIVGVGDGAQRWNNLLYQILGSYPAALPANRAGVEGDAATGLRGALFTANANGLPVRIGAWVFEDSDWQYRAETTYVPLSADAEWEIATQARSALIAAKSAADAS